MHVEIENNAMILYIYCRSVISSSYLYLFLCYDALLMAAQYLIVRNVVCHSTGLVYVRQHLDRMLEAGASWTIFSSMKSEGTGELEGNLACVSVNMNLLNAFQNIKKLSLKLNTGLPA